MKEEDIRPRTLVEPFLKLSEQDAEHFFAGCEKRPVSCVGCGNPDSHGVFQFTKTGFDYVRCSACGSLYHSPRASVEQFAAFYRDSKSWRYWSDTYFPAIAESRRSEIFRPRVGLLGDICRKRNISVDTLVEVGAGYGIFLEEWRHANPGTLQIAVEPSPTLAHECRAKGFEVIEDVAENVKSIDGRADLVVCFEVLEHVYDPLEFIRTLARFAKPGGHVMVTTLGIDGFDLQMLGRNSASIFPPHHINFPSMAGFKALFSRAQLIDVDVSTPGRLDVDIVRNALRADSSLLSGQEFIRRIVQDDALGKAFQQFLVENRLSSHTWVMGRKPHV